MNGLPYTVIPDPPSKYGAGALLSRLADGIGFRYRWATEGLSDEDLAFRPVAGSMSLGDLLVHIHGLLRWVALNVGLPEGGANMRPPEGVATRARTLNLARELAVRFAGMEDEQIGRLAMKTQAGDVLPFWNAVNGPLSDSLTHIGQVNSWRRMRGKPVPAADVFRGKPPREAM